MSQSDIYLGRGIVTLGGTDAGLVSGLVLRHEIETVPRQVFDGTADGGSSHVGRRVSAVRVEMVLYEYQSAIINTLIQATAGDFWTGSQAAITLAYAGVNAHQNACSAVTLAATLFLADPPSIPVITDELASITVTGQLLRDVGETPEWYDLDIA